MLCIRDDWRPPAISWAPEKPELSIARCNYARKFNTRHVQYPAVFILDASTGSLECSLYPVIDDRFQAFCQHYNQLQWSASGQHLLIASHSGMQESNISGTISVVNIRGDQISVQSEFSMQVYDDLTTVAIWPPSYVGVTLSYGVELKSPEAFATSGLALGTLPERCIVMRGDGSGFSSDGQAARFFQELEEDAELLSYGQEPKWDYVIFRCYLEFVPELQEQGYQCHWVPFSSRLIVGFRSAAFWKRSCLISATTRVVEFDFSASEEMRFPVCFSPAQQMLGESTNPGRVYCLQTGHRLWRLNHPAQTLSGAVPERMLAFLPSGCGVICQASLREKAYQTVLVVYMYA